jgi:hypothetical protein
LSQFGGVVAWHIATTSAVLTVNGTEVIPVTAAASLLGWDVATGLTPAAGSIAEHVRAAVAAGGAGCTAAYNARGAEVCGYVLDFNFGAPISSIGWVAARPALGIVALTWEITGANTARYTSANVGGAWNGGGAPVLEDEDRTIYTSEVSTSPYDPNADTYVRLGTIPRQRTRWSAARADYISPRRQAIARPGDTGNVLDSLVAHAAAGGDLYLNVEGRPRLIGRLDASNPSWQDYATQAGSSGQRYDVEMDLRLVTP